MGNFFRNFILAIMFAVLFWSQGSATYAMGWEVTFGTPQQTNFKSVTLSNELFLKHEIAISNPKRILVNENTLYVVDSTQTKLTAISLETKAVNWEFSPPNEKDIRNIAIVNGNIAVSSYGKTYFLKDEGFNKSIIWENDAWGNHINFDEQRIYTTNPEAITAINIQTGQKDWSYTIPSINRLMSSSSISSGGLFFVTDDMKEGGYKLFGLNKQNGQVLWTTYYPNPVYTPMIVNDKVFLSYQNKVGSILTSTGAYAFNKTIGTELFSGTEEALSSNGELIFARTNKGKIIGFDSQTGDIRFQTDFQDGSYRERNPFSRGPILVTANQVILENNGKLKFFDSKTGDPEHILSYGAYKMDPVLVTDKYLIAKNSEKLFVYAPPADPQYEDPDGDVQPEQPPAPNPDEKQIIYVVQAGDTLWKIANQFGTTVQNIVEMNKLDPNAYIWVGQNLTVPKPQKTHVVQAGDVLWKIASQYGVTIQSIVDANKLSSASNIWIGQKLIIPETEKTYTVQAGDTLWKISVKFNTTIQEIVAKNNLDPAKYLWVGQQLIIPGT